MEFAWYIYVLAILAGILAGIINTLAGSGSLVTLPMLIFLGLPDNVANGTNRVGVIMQNIVGITTYQRRRTRCAREHVVHGSGGLGSLVGKRIAVDLTSR
ncbi:MAG: TSUP family transporter [Caldilineaceae bacterium]